MAPFVTTTILLSPQRPSLHPTPATHVQVFMLSDDAVIDKHLLEGVISAGHSRVPVHEGSNKQASALPGPDVRGVALAPAVGTAAGRPGANALPLPVIAFHAHTPARHKFLFEKTQTKSMNIVVFHFPAGHPGAHPGQGPAAGG